MKIKKEDIGNIFFIDEYGDTNLGIKSFFIDSKIKYGNIIPENNCFNCQLMENNRIWKANYLQIGDENHKISLWMKLYFYIKYKLNPCRCYQCNERSK